MIRLGQVLAISFVGVGALVLSLQNQYQDAMFLYGALATWALKNGYSQLSDQRASGTVPSAVVGVGTAKLDSTTTLNESISDSLLSLADEGYENSW